MSATTTSASYMQLVVQQSWNQLITGNDSFFMFFMTAFIFVMQFGFGLFESGVARTSYSIKRTLLKTILCIMLTMIVYWIFGYALAFGGTNAFGGGQTFWAYSYMINSQNAHFWLQYGFAVTAVTVALGAWSERCNIIAYLVFTFVWAGFAYPIVSHWGWTLVGYLYMGQSINYNNVSSLQIATIALDYMYNPNSYNPALVSTAAQYLDVSGSGIVHLSGGIASLVGALFLGPRTQRFDVIQASSFAPHSSTLMSIGAAIIFFGMLAFNCAGLQSINYAPAGMAAMAMVNTVLAAGAAMCLVYIVNMCKIGTYDMFRIIKGGIAGTVAVSCSAAVIYPWGAVIVGGIAGLAYMMWSAAMLRWKVDDVTDAFAIHAGASMWGIVAFSFLHPQFGILFSVTSSGLFLGWQLAGICCIWVWCGAIATIIFGFLRLFRVLRIPVEVEMKGVQTYTKISSVLATNEPEREMARSETMRSEDAGGERPVSTNDIV